MAWTQGAGRELLAATLLLAAPAATARAASGTGAAPAGGAGSESAGRSVTVTPTSFAASAGVTLTLRAAGMTPGARVACLAPAEALAPGTAPVGCTLPPADLYCGGSDPSDLSSWPPIPLPPSY